MAPEIPTTKTAAENDMTNTASTPLTTLPAPAGQQRNNSSPRKSNFAGASQQDGPADVVIPTYATFNNMTNVVVVKPTEEQELLDMIEMGYGQTAAAAAQQQNDSSPIQALLKISTNKKTAVQSAAAAADTVRIDPWDMLKHIDHYNFQEFSAWELAREINWNYRELLFDNAGKNVYLDACSFLGVIPNSSFVRALERAREQSHELAAASDGGHSPTTNNNNSKKIATKTTTYNDNHLPQPSSGGSQPFEAVAVVVVAAQGLEIDLASSGIDDVGCRAMCIGLVNNTNITSVKLADNRIGPIGADYIQQLFHTNLYIVDVDLSNNNLGHEGCRYVCYYLLTKKCHMRMLRTARNQWGDREIALVAAALERNRSLLLWDLSHNAFSERCGQLFGAALAENDTLVELNLSWNRIRGRGFGLFFAGFKQNVRLTVLHLQHNDMGDRAAQQLAEAMRAKCNLTYVDLSACNINLLGVERFLSKVLTACEELRTLRLAHNPITHQGAYLMLTVCAETARIELLDLSGITVQQPKFMKFLQALKLPRTFQVLHGASMAMNGPLPAQPLIKSAENKNKKKKKK